MNKKKERSIRKTFESLTIIEVEGGSIRPKAFAHILWPDSPGWVNSRACGPKGRHQGMGMYCSAGCYLGTLAKKGYVVKKGKEYHITQEGLNFLNEMKQIVEKEVETVLNPATPVV